MSDHHMRTDLMALGTACGWCGGEPKGNASINGTPYCHDDEQRCYEIAQRLLPTYGAAAVNLAPMWDFGDDPVLKFDTPTEGD